MKCFDHVSNQIDDIYKVCSVSHSCFSRYGGNMVKQCLKIVFDSAHINLYGSDVGDPDFEWLAIPTSEYGPPFHADPWDLEFQTVIHHKILVQNVNLVTFSLFSNHL